jgi:pantoate--beta-alanine ligase
MIVCKTISEIDRALETYRVSNKSIGFVPTMGALHNGHLNLVKHAILENDIVVCSIFVNPIQFNKAEDLEKYPRTFKKDKDLLDEIACDILFAPEVDEIYPEKVFDKYDFGGLDRVMEGKFRPGHFNGVAVVVRKLFEIVRPDKAYFGKKDFQQLRIIQTLTEKLRLPVEIVACETAREKDGLAMSSRNIRLTKSQRSVAPAIFRILQMVAERAGTMPPRDLEKWATDQLNNYQDIEVEYLQIVNTYDLTPVDYWDETAAMIVCVAANIGDVRLIDNLLIIS